MRNLLYAFLLVFLAGCSAGSESDDVDIVIGVDAIQVTNGTSARLYYDIVAERRYEFAQPPSLNHEFSIDAGATLSVDTESFTRGSDEKEYLFLWWHATTRNGQPVAPSTHNIIEFRIP